MPSENRGTGVALPVNPASVGIPPRVFLWTLDQIATMLNLQTRDVAARYVYFEGRSIGSRKRELMIARNIAPEDADPEWRVAERELVRWLRTKGFRYYERGAFSS